MGINVKTENNTNNILDTMVEKVVEQYDNVQANSGLKDGVDYINVSPHGETELGRMLFLTHSHPFNTFLGKCANIKNFMSAITKVSFPIRLLSKPKLTKEEKEKIFGDKSGVKNVPNYWALIAYAFTEKVKADTKLQELLVNNNLEFVSFKIIKNKPLFNKYVDISIPDESMLRYIAIIKYVETLLKEGRFNTDTITEFIEKCKYRPELDITDGIALNITIAISDGNDSHNGESKTDD